MKEEFELMKIFAIIAIALVAAFYYLIVRKDDTNRSGKFNLKKSESHKAPGKKTDKRYRAASIHCQSSACTAASGIAGKRFLVGSVPRIPLQQCNSKKCDCRYSHHDDRRSTGDRRALYCLKTDLYSVTGEIDHRLTVRGRRKLDIPLHAA